MVMANCRKLTHATMLRFGQHRLGLPLRNVHNGPRYLAANSVCLILCSALMFLGSSALAQGPDSGLSKARGASMEGVVTLSDQQNQSQPIAGVRVTLSPGSASSQILTTTTDAAGHYQFTELAPGVYKLEASLEGFRSFAESAELKQGQMKIENFSLQLDKVVQQVEVRDKAAAVATESADSTATVSSRQFSTLPLAEQKFKEALPLVPGVVRRKNGTLNIKGAPENQGMLLVDSARTVDPVTGSFSIPIPVDTIQMLNVYKAPYSAEYGGFSGGLTTIESRPPSGNCSAA